MAVTVTGTGSNSVSGGSPITLTNNSGDYGLILVSGDDITGAVTGISPGTWTNVYHDTLSVDGQFVEVWECQALTGSASYTVTGSLGADCSACAIACDGQSVTPVNVRSTTLTDSNIASDWNIAAPSITTTVDGCLLIALYGLDTTSGSYGTSATAPSGYGGTISEHSTASWAHCGLAYKTQTTQGATGTATFVVSPTSGSSAGFVAYHFAIAPASGGPVTAPTAALVSVNLQRKRVLLPPIFRG